MTTSDATNLTSRTGERFICFSLGEREFGIPLLAVKEVIAVPEFTPVPFAPTYFCGIMNLRGQVISVIDLRAKMGIKPLKNDVENAVIICELGDICMGIIVDSVNSVANPKANELLSPPTVDNTKGPQFIDKVFQHNDRLTLFLDISKILNAEDKSVLKQNTQPKKSA